MMTVKEVAEQVSISPSTIRYYDNQGLLPFVRRDKNGYRVFKENELFWLELIRYMRKTGMPVKALQRIVHLQLKGNETLTDQIQIIEEHQERLRKQIKEIELSLIDLEDIKILLEIQR
ncbi:MerR family transcriptional regulator [Virgibacillus oceani]